MSSSDEAAMLNEVRIAIREALREGNSLQAHRVSRIIAAAYPRSGLSTAEVLRRVILEAATAGVPLLAVTWLR